MSAEEKMFEEAMSAVDGGDIARARDLFTRLLRTDQYNPTYWLWMSSTVDTVKERIYCLKQVLELDPQNSAAKRGLILLGQLPPDASLVIPMSLQTRKWQVELMEKAPKVSARSMRMIVLYSGAALLLVALLAGAVTGIVALVNRPAKVVIRPTFVVFATVTETPTPTLNARRTQIQPTATPPWGGLPTPTPTPMMMSTPHNRLEAYSIAMRAFQKGEWERAVSNFQQVVAAEPDAADIFYLIGEAYRYQNSYNEALTAYNDAIAANANYAPSYLGRARLRLARFPDQLDSPQEDLEKAIALDPNLGEAYLELALVNVQHDQMDAALENLDIAESLMQNTPLLYLTRAQVLLAEEEYAQALTDVDLALQLDPSIVLAYRIRGEIFNAQGEYEDALDAMQTFTTYGNPTAKDWLWVAETNLKLDQVDAALNAVSKSIVLDRTSYRPYLMRADIYMTQQDGENALKDYTSATGWNPYSFEASIGRARALNLLGAFGDAYEQFGKSRSLAETDEQMAQFHYGRALAAEGLDNSAAAVYDWLNLLKLPEDATSAEMRATAEEHLALLYTPTPTRRSTLTPTITRTPRTSATPTATRTPRPSTPTP